MIITVGEERAGLSASRAFVFILHALLFVLIFFFGVKGWLRLVTVVLPGLFINVFKMFLATFLSISHEKMHDSTIILIKNENEKIISTEYKSKHLRNVKMGILVNQESLKQCWVIVC